MLQLNSNIASALIGSLTLEELEAMVEQKRQDFKKLSAPVKMTEKDKIRNYCIDLLKKKLYAPRYK
ncbi:MAG TPA: hypothetical protein DER05_05080 [Lutibacter sp.]|nr:hypothetical protein [Lutibacter sp.]